jgi:hypothetical protein
LTKKLTAEELYKPAVFEFTGIAGAFEIDICNGIKFGFLY